MTFPFPILLSQGKIPLFDGEGNYLNVQRFDSGLAQATRSFTTPLGTASATRTIIVVFSGLFSGNSGTFPTFSSATIAGVTAHAAMVGGAISGNNRHGTVFFSARVPTGTSGTFTVTSNIPVIGFYTVWAIDGLDSHIPIEHKNITGSVGSQTVTVTVPANGVVLVGSFANSGTTPTLSNCYVGYKIGVSDSNNGNRNCSFGAQQFPASGNQSFTASAATTISAAVWR